MLRRSLAIFALLVAPAIVACDDPNKGGDVYTESTGRIGIAAVLHYQVDALGRDQAQGYYSSYSKEAQARCSLDEFRPRFAQARQGTVAGATDLTNLSINFKDAAILNAAVSYTITVKSPDERPLRPASGNYIRDKDTWYQNDSPCAIGGA